MLAIEIEALPDQSVESVRRVRRAWSARYAVLTFLDEHDVAARVRREVTNKLQTGLKQPRGPRAP